MKVHVLLDHDDYMPRWILVGNAREHDSLGARLLTPVAGSIIAFDRAYNDYDLFAKWTDQGVYFVTRMKSNADYDVVEERPVSGGGKILSDEVIRLASAKAHKACPHVLRRVVVWDDANAREIVLLTNHLAFAASTIASIYKDRWEIEIFFKALKQNLKIRTFVGTNENALLTQIWTALIALLLLRWLHHLSHASWSFSNLACMARLSLFTYRDLRDWIKGPLGQPTGPSPPPIGVQLELPLPGFGQPART